MTREKAVTLVRRWALRPLREAWTSLVAMRAELLTTAAILAGWALLTYGIAALTAPIAWAFSAGVLLLSLAGWELLSEIARRGLYNLTREKPGRAGNPGNTEGRRRA